MSLGIAALRSLVREAARLFPEAEIEIVETHHSRKADAPSGTARMLAAAVQKERPEAALVCGRSGFHRELTARSAYPPSASAV